MVWQKNDKSDWQLVVIIKGKKAHDTIQDDGKRGGGGRDTSVCNNTVVVRPVSAGTNEKQR